MALVGVPLPGVELSVLMAVGDPTLRLHAFKIKTRLTDQKTSAFFKLEGLLDITLQIIPAIVKLVVK